MEQKKQRIEQERRARGETASDSDESVDSDNDEDDRDYDPNESPGSNTHDLRGPDGRFIPARFGKKRACANSARTFSANEPYETRDASDQCTKAAPYVAGEINRKRPKGTNDSSDDGRRDDGREIKGWVF